MVFQRAGAGFRMEDFLTGLTALGYATAHVSLNMITGELLWGRKHPSVLFLSRLAKRDVGLDTTVTQMTIHSHPSFYLK